MLRKLIAVASFALACSLSTVQAQSIKIVTSCGTVSPAFSTAFQTAPFTMDINGNLCIAGSFSQTGGTVSNAASAQATTSTNQGSVAWLYGFNGILVGLALATFLASGPLIWVYVILGAAVSVVGMLATTNVVKPWGGALTFPFVLTTWLLLLATYGFTGLVGTALPSGNVVTAFQPYQASPLQLIDLVQGVFQSISQVFLKGSGIAAVLLLAGLAVNSLAAAAFALGGSILAVLTAHLFGAESELITGGLLGFSPVLTSIALGTVFYQPSWRVVAYTVLATVFTVIAQSALNVALTPFAIPALTAPFVLVTWLFLLPRQRLEEVPAVAPDIEKRNAVA